MERNFFRTFLWKFHTFFVHLVLDIPFFFHNSQDNLFASILIGYFIHLCHVLLFLTNASTSSTHGFILFSSFSLCWMKQFSWHPNAFILFLSLSPFGAKYFPYFRDSPCSLACLRRYLPIISSFFSAFCFLRRIIFFSIQQIHPLLHIFPLLGEISPQMTNFPAHDKSPRRWQISRKKKETTPKRCRFLPRIAVTLSVRRSHI